MVVFANGTPKGAQVILQERGLWRQNFLCSVRISRSPTAFGPSALSDAATVLAGFFLSSPTAGLRSFLAEIVEMQGHRRISLPKKPSKLNPLSFIWGHSKHHIHRDCCSSTETLRNMVSKCLRPEVVSDELVLSYFRRVNRILEAYRDGIEYGSEKL